MTGDMRRRALLWLSLLSLASLACAGPSSTLKTLGTPSGTGPIDFQVENRSSAIINNLYLARTSDVRAAPDAAFVTGSPEQARLWGEDRLPGSGLEVGGSLPIRVEAPGRYDVRVIDRDEREQHIAGLELRAGGRYILEVNDGSWLRPR